MFINISYKLQLCSNLPVLTGVSLLTESLLPPSLPLAYNYSPHVK